MEDFINTKPMLTPAIAGTATMTITSALVGQFDLKASLTALIISFLIGSLVWAEKSLPVIQRAVIYLINSITIFAVAVGINESAVGMTQAKEPVSQERSAPPQGEEERVFVRSWF